MNSEWQDSGEIVPKRELRFRDFWWPVYYFFWKNTWFIRRIKCKHEGVHMCGTSTKYVTVCANCFSPKVPQCCGTSSLINS